MAAIQRIVAGQPIHVMMSTIYLAVRAILYVTITLRHPQTSNTNYTDIAVMPKEYSSNHYTTCIGLRTIKYISNYTNKVLTTIPFFQCISENKFFD